MTIFHPTPKNCDICHSPLGSVMYDAKTRSGPWGCLCSHCFQRENGRLGPGLGQKYERNKENRFLLTKGRTS